jgi:hypothetical protein
MPLLGGFMACPHNLFHAPHLAGFEPHLDAVWVGGGFREVSFTMPLVSFPLR